MGKSQQLQDGSDILNGTLHFDSDLDLLQLYINDWVTVNMHDTDTTLSFDSDDINVDEQEIYYLKFIETTETVDNIFGSKLVSLTVYECLTIGSVIPNISVS